MSSFKRNPVVKFLASLKLAVMVISLMIIFMTWGTITESRYGTEYAKAGVYLSWPFIGVQIFLFLNILFAALVRLPPQKRLYGFYTVHTGLLCILVGSAITAKKGIDGSVELLPGEPAGYARLSHPQLHAVMYGSSEKKTASVFLPLASGVVNGSSQPIARFDHYDIFVDKYYPFAKAEYSWVDNEKDAPPSLSVWLTLANQQMSQNVFLSSLDAETSTKKMGPLGLQIEKDLDAECFKKGVADKNTAYVLQTSDECLLLAKLKTDEEFTKNGITIKAEKTEPHVKLLVTAAGSTHTFYPQMQAYPMTADFQIDANSGIKLFDVTKWQASPHVIFFMDNTLAYGKNTEWKFEKSELAKNIELPWMGLTIVLDRKEINRHQKTKWEYALPDAKENKRPERAALIRVESKDGKSPAFSLWVGNSEPSIHTLPDGSELQMLIWPEMFKLPFTITLDRFKMDTNPGTNDPASYESFVNLDENGELSQAHVFMNNPLKRAGLTFYQSSYFQLEDGQYGSVFSVNKDPGRALKYGGSFLLVIGCILHYYLRRRVNSPGKNP